jgi:hypothetical protein
MKIENYYSGDYCLLHCPRFYPRPLAESGFKD